MSESIAFAPRSSTPMLRIGGVPEPFNYPWQLAADLPHIEWRAFPGGTGAMIEALKTQSLDLAIMLTEGAVTAIGNGLPARICGVYLRSPLEWGVYANQPLVLDKSAPRVGISRKGSGSELMAAVMRLQREQDPAMVEFVECGDIHGLRDALVADEIDFFLWEAMMTQPYVAAGLFQRVGLVPTPWPPLVMVAPEPVLKHRADDIARVSARVFERMSLDLAELDAMATEYQVPVQEIDQWMKRAEFGRGEALHQAVFAMVVEVLAAIGRVDADLAYQDVVIA